VLIIGLGEANGKQEYQSCVSGDEGMTFTCATMLEGHVPAGSVLFKDSHVMTILRDVSNTVQVSSNKPSS